MCFFPIFHSSSLLPTALPSPFKYVEEAEYLVRILGFFLRVRAKAGIYKQSFSPPNKNQCNIFLFSSLYYSETFILECLENMNVKTKERLIIISLTAIIITAINLILFPHLFDNSESTADTQSVTTASASANSQTVIFQENQASVQTTAFSATSRSHMPDNISAPYAGLYNLSTGEAIYEKSADTKISPASLAKILTAVTALNYMDSNTVITVDNELELLPKHSSLCLISKGHRLTLYDLLTGMLVSSGNDAAYTIAVNVARHHLNRNDISDRQALSYFTDLMNSVAKAIGCTDSDFTTPDGFDSQGQHTTVRDLMLICSYALTFKEIREITATVKKKVIFESGENVTWSNSNKLLHKESPYYYSSASGMKTGTTPLAGMCLTAVADINGQAYLAIVCGCQSEDDRYTSAIKLFDLASCM